MSAGIWNVTRLQGRVSTIDSYSSYITAITKDNDQNVDYLFITNLKTSKTYKKSK